MKSVDKTTAQIGEAIQYTILITNTSTIELGALNVSDILSADLDFVFASQNGEIQNGIVSWNIEKIAPGQSSELTLNVTVSENAQVGQQIANTAKANITNTEQKESETVLVLIVAVDAAQTTLVRILKTQDVTTVESGQLVNYTITISNEGDFTAENIVLTDFLPEGVLVINISGKGKQENGLIRWLIPSLTVGEVQVFQLQVLVTAEQGSISNKASVTGDNFPTEEAQTLPLIIGKTNPADLKITKEVSASLVAVGKEFEYKITIQNKLDSLATSILVTDTLPSKIEFISATTSAGSATYSTGDRVVSWILDTLGPLASQTLVIKAQAKETGEINNTAYAVIGEDLDLSDNKSSVSHSQVEFLVPNVFTPNGDGFNDTWEILGLTEFFLSSEVVIVNRWGIEVFRATNYQNDWIAEGLAGGTYFYLLTGVDKSDEKRTLTGYLTIIK